MAKPEPNMQAWTVLALGVVIGILSAIIVYFASAIQLAGTDPNKCPVYNPNNPNCPQVIQ